MNTNLRGRDLITLRDFSRDELQTMLDLAFDLKVKVASRQPHLLLSGKSLGMLFSYASTRTRIAFETGMTQLGGHAQYYEPSTLQVGAAAEESWEDTAKVLTRYVDGIVVRMLLGDVKYGAARAVINTIAECSYVPVISASDDQGHPCQALADIMTIIERFGPDFRRRKVVMSWVCSKRGISPGVTHDFAAAAGALGMNVTIACPEGYDLDPDYIDPARRAAGKYGGTLEVVHDLDEAVRGASVIYAKGYRAIGKNVAEDLKMREPFKDWRITERHFSAATPDAVFMNAMPVSRETDASPEVVDGSRSVIFDEAENRLHAQKAVMALVMG